MPRPLDYAEKHRSRFLADLKQFISFPSVSAQPKHAEDLKRCADWLATHLRHIGLHNAKIIPTRRHPLVYADWLGRPAGPTLLIYGHYDVQPPEPLKEWHSPPFTGTVRANNLHARGACDDKGQMFAHVKALEACLETQKRLPVNVKCLFEGEEEIGSPNLHGFVARNRRSLAANAAVISDMPIPGPDRPAIAYALRGGLSVELEVKGPERDLHSGLYGGAVHNPLQALCGIVAQLHDAHGRVTIPGFYDGVRKASESERKYMARTGPSDAELLRNAGAAKGWGERGYNLYERTTLRPALTINGITGGYQGVGGKGVIPARAVVKLSFRLVPDQSPRVVERQLRRYLQQKIPETVHWQLQATGHAVPVVLDTKHPAIRAAALAYRKGFGKAPIFLRCGGTIPVVNTFQQTLGIQTVLMGFALPDDRMHAPNEKLFLPNFYNGIATSIWFLHLLSAAREAVRQKGEREQDSEVLALSEVSRR
jgi:acetylornithine deacetylase/succinyl-diaminopimelate desuccinylase-like protein